MESTNRSLFEAPYFFGYICEDDVFDENGKVKIRVRNHYECEVLQLNRTFAEKYHLHNDSSSYVAADYQKDSYRSTFRIDAGIDRDDFQNGTNGFSWCPANPYIPQRFRYKIKLGILLASKDKREKALCTEKKLVKTTLIRFAPRQGF
ncbi:Oidioi.mRNA.OKI2018_I69.chr2.g4748.t1.cds [Oikopleura dioica]|uniref:Oidioi.mRNA.OKI2018_I69.chr2.g4748.t1.cds n=1 Tax=Oikopleura dioica TaxID=34765 RepID=A0ABN7SYQ2_OIKDI|nr:Oidioi.mRNA.OKI2018_I69.chr2.g4748.t1.cds [Oikopleura dioica]